jgi:hypothetical protein
MIKCSIAMRRLAEATNLAHRCKNLHVSLADIHTSNGSVRPDRKGSISLWKLVVSSCTPDQSK